ncbi:MAG TPA: DUF4157 domain-containing protein [Allosphingosinicella sp.]|nr:DUF4157 domain-containing protein [Allosphingosinicella sp.]
MMQARAGKAAPQACPGKAPPHRLAAAVQPKLAVARSDDAFEQEADRIADRVMGMAEPKSQPDSAGPAPGGPRPPLEAAPPIRRRAENAGAAAEAGDSLISGLGSGRPLDSALRRYFEPRFGADFSRVRIHTGIAADKAARSVEALAFTYGNDVVFRSDRYSPGPGQGRRLIAHELAHVVQQRGSGPRIQRQAACPPRIAGEVARSRTPGGILTTNVILRPIVRQLDIVDFPVEGATVPPGVAATPEWQRAMSMIAGDPSMFVAVEGFTDCAGSHGENVAIRRDRARAVIALMPPAVQAKVLFNFSMSTTTFLDVNLTEAGRAGNRAVRITFSSVPPRGQTACDMARPAQTFDQYLFLVRCLETRLGLTAAADAPTTLSVLRQIYYGSASWTPQPDATWNFVIPDRPWSPGRDPTPALQAPLMAALQASQDVEGTDIGHILTGMDAMMRPEQVLLRAGPFGLRTNLANEEWATWAGDVGSAATRWAFDTYMGGSNLSPAVYFQNWASDADLIGDIDSFALRAGGSGAPPQAQLMARINLGGPLSETLLQYFRITSSALGTARARRIENFVQAYGGVIRGRRLANRALFVARLRPSVEEFARLFAIRRLLSPGPNPQRPSTAPPFDSLLVGAIDVMTELFVRWLEARL